MNYIDPYYQHDPTIATLPLARQGRTYSGKFSAKSVWTDVTEDHFPIDSVGWRSYALGAFQRLGRIVCDRYYTIANAIIPNEVIEKFSWRMVCEMVDAAADQAEKTPTDDQAIIAAGHKFLMDKQSELKGEPAHGE